MGFETIDWASYLTKRATAFWKPAVVPAHVDQPNHSHGHHEGDHSNEDVESSPKPCLKWDLSTRLL